MHGGLSQFRATQQRRKERSESRDKGGFDRKSNNSFADNSTPDFNFPKMSESEFQEFKAELVKNGKRKKRTEILILILTLLITSIALILIFN